MAFETQQTISDWAEATFGPVSSNARVAARANEEMAELLRCLTSGNEAKAAEEAADVVIVLCRLATRLGHALDMGPGEYLSALRWGVKANDWLASVLCTLAVRDDDRAAIGSLNLCAFNLANLARHLGTSVQAEVDRKMAVNRARVWKLDGSGHGYHVRPK